MMRASCYLLLLSFAALIVLQGGYYSGATCLVGSLTAVVSLGFCIFAFIGKRRVGIPIVSACFAIIGILSFASAGANEADLAMVAQCFPWFATASVTLLCVFDHDGERLQKGLCAVGIVASAVSMLMLSDLLDFPGAVNAGRLQFTFQYANTAGIFFAICSVLCICSKDRIFVKLAVLPMLSLMTTQSIGSYIVFAAAFIVLFVMRIKEGDSLGAMRLVVGALLSCIAFVICLTFGIEYSLLCSVVIGSLNWVCIDWLTRNKGSLPSGRSIAFVFVLIAVLACFAVIILIPSRLLQASSTLLERFDQMRDACILISQSPIFGLGPDGWESAYAFVQSTDYIASSVHNSYLQVWLDTGLLGFLVFVGMLVFGIWGAWRSGRYAIVVCIAMMALHFLIDFDIQFSSVGGLLGVLLYLCCAEVLSVKARGLAVKFSALLLSVLVLGACVCGVAVNDQLDSVSTERIELAE